MMNSQPRSQGFLQAFDKDYLSQGDRGEYLLKMAATKVMCDMVTRCLHNALLFFALNECNYCFGVF